MYKHLRLSIIHGESEHPQETMKRLGITYQHATPQSMGDQWWFWNCENVPDVLPPNITELEIDPMLAVGHGLSMEMAKEICNYNSYKNETV